MESPELIRQRHRRTGRSMGMPRPVQTHSRRHRSGKMGFALQHKSRRPIWRQRNTVFYRRFRRKDFQGRYRQLRQDSHQMDGLRQRQLRHCELERRPRQPPHSYWLDEQLAVCRRGADNAVPQRKHAAPRCQPIQL